MSSERDWLYPAGDRPPCQEPGCTKPVWPVLSLAGLDGNAFALMGAWKAAARRVGWTPDQIGAVLADATAGDYDHLLRVLLANSTPPEGE